MAKPKAKTKTTSRRDYDDPLALHNELAAIDRKDYTYFNRLTEDQKKQFSPYLMLRYSSAVEGSGDIAKYYAVATNEFVNQDFWALNGHKELQWLLCCTVSPGIGKQRHYWLGKAQKASGNKLRKLLLELLPQQKEDEIDLILKTNTKEEILLWISKMGLETANLE